MPKRQYEIHPMIRVKLINRHFELLVLRAIFAQENECRSLFKLPEHPTTWGWVSRTEIASRMGFPTLTKTLSRKIRKAFVWLTICGYLKYWDVNQPGNCNGATRFLLAFFIMRLVTLTHAGVLLGHPKSKAVSRTVAVAPPGWKPPGWMAGRLALATHANI